MAPEGSILDKWIDCCHYKSSRIPEVKVTSARAVNTKRTLVLICQSLGTEKKSILLLRFHRKESQSGRRRSYWKRTLSPLLDTRPQGLLVLCALSTDDRSQEYDNGLLLQDITRPACTPATWEAEAGWKVQCLSGIHRGLKTSSCNLVRLPQKEKKNFKNNLEHSSLVELLAQIRP